MTIGSNPSEGQSIHSMGQPEATESPTSNSLDATAHLNNESSRALPQNTKSQAGQKLLKSFWSTIPERLHKISFSLIFYKAIGSHFKTNKHAELLNSVGPLTSGAFRHLEKGGDLSQLVQEKGIFELKEKIPQLELVMKAKIKSGDLSPKQQAKMKADIAILKEMAASAEAMHEDQFMNVDKINHLTVRRIQMREGKPSLSSQFPEKLTMSDLEKGTMVDQNGKEFDHLRGPDGLTEKGFKEFCNSHGGNYKTIEDWLEGQAGNSWSPDSMAVKCRLMEFRNEDASQYYWQLPYEDEWGGGAVTQTANMHGNYRLNEHELGQVPFEEFKKTLDESLISWMAFNMEFLSHTEMEGTDHENQTITIYRTESHAGLEANGIDSKNLDTVNEHSMKRSVFESGSIGKPIIAAATKGAIITEQKVPLHRCLFCYQLKPLMDDNEKEIGFITKDIKFKLKQWE